MADINDTLAEREKRYGSFATHAWLSQRIQESMRMHGKWGHLAPLQQEALTMIAHKIARILNGDPNYADNWHDIAGYTTLAEKGCGQ